MRPDGYQSRLRWLPLVAAMMLATGCGNKTTVINQAPPPAPQPGVPRPEGPTSREEAEFLIQDAYVQGRQEGMREAWGELPEDERERRKAAAEMRRSNWVRRRQQLRQEILTDVLADKYGQKFEELVEAWKEQNPDQSFECCEQEDEDPVEVDSPPPEDVVDQPMADEPEKENPIARVDPPEDDAEKENPIARVDPPEDPDQAKVPGSADNLDCWSRLCPSVAAIIEAPLPEMPRRPRERQGPGGWLGAGPGAGVDLEEIGVTLPNKDPIPEEELMPLLEQAHAKGVEDGKEFAGLSEEERLEHHKQRWAEREQRVKERMQERLEERLAEAIEDCKADDGATTDCSAEGAECNDDGGIGLEDSAQQVANP